VLAGGNLVQDWSWSADAAEGCVPPIMIGSVDGATGLRLGTTSMPPVVAQGTPLEWSIHVGVVIAVLQSRQLTTELHVYAAP
jgi:hypothetical protein